MFSLDFFFSSFLPLFSFIQNTCKNIVSAFKTEIATSSSSTIHFNAGAITWGTTPSYLKDGGNVSTLKSDLASLERAFAAAKSLEPSGVTYYGAPFTWFEHELKSRGAASQEGSYQAQRQLNFVIFLTDGLSNDYQPDPTNGKDMPFGGDYSTPLSYAGDFGETFCGNRGWCNALENGCKNTGVDASATCSSANVIRAVKDIPGTTVVGIYVGDRKGYGPQVLHNVSSCDEYEFDPLKPMNCPNTFSVSLPAVEYSFLFSYLTQLYIMSSRLLFPLLSFLFCYFKQTSSFASLIPTVIPTVSKLMEQATGLQGICECCGPGTYSSACGQMCMKCPVGTWASGFCSTQCEPCPTLTASTVDGLTDATQCSQLCGALNSNEVSVLCSGASYGNGLVAESFSTAICTNATCDASGPSSPDAAICCLKDATCASVNTVSEITSLCKNNGGNGLIDILTTPCNGNPCTAANDATTCCKPSALCSSMTTANIVEVCKGELQSNNIFDQTLLTCLHVYMYGRRSVFILLFLSFLFIFFLHTKFHGVSFRWLKLVQHFARVLFVDPLMHSAGTLTAYFY